MIGLYWNKDLQNHKNKFDDDDDDDDDDGKKQKVFFINNSK